MNQVAAAKKSPPIKDSWLKAHVRAEDIILGSIGLGDDAKLQWVKRTDDGFAGEAKWSDGEVFTFQSDDEMTELEQWAIELLKK